ETVAGRVGGLGVMAPRWTPRSQALLGNEGSRSSASSDTSSQRTCAFVGTQPRSRASRPSVPKQSLGTRQRPKRKKKKRKASTRRKLPCLPCSYSLLFWSCFRVFRVFRGCPSLPLKAIADRGIDHLLRRPFAAPQRDHRLRRRHGHVIARLQVRPGGVRRHH